MGHGGTLPLAHPLAGSEGVTRRISVSEREQSFDAVIAPNLFAEIMSPNSIRIT
jgi:hypothetical protein